MDKSKRKGTRISPERLPIYRRLYELYESEGKDWEEALAIVQKEFRDVETAQRLRKSVLPDRYLRHKADPETWNRIMSASLSAERSPRDEQPAKIEHLSPHTERPEREPEPPEASEPPERSAHEKDRASQPERYERYEDIEARMTEIAMKVCRQMVLPNILNELKAGGEPLPITGDMPPEPSRKGRKEARSYMKFAATVDVVLFDLMTKDAAHRRLSLGKVLDMILWNYYGKPALSYQLTPEELEPFTKDRRTGR